MRRCTARANAVAGWGWALLGLLVGAAAAQELYHDRQPLDEDTVYFQDYNLFDMAAAAGVNQQQGRVLTKDIMLYNLLIRSLAQEDSRNTIKYSPDWIQALDDEISQHQHLKDHEYVENTTLEKDGVVKRLASALRGTGTVVKSLNRRSGYDAAQSKDKKGSRMVCYFKLCAFQP